jgi:hypothetical protein
VHHWNSTTRGRPHRSNALSELGTSETWRWPWPVFVTSLPNPSANSAVENQIRPGRRTFRKPLSQVGRRFKAHRGTWFRIWKIWSTNQFETVWNADWLTQQSPCQNSFIFSCTRIWKYRKSLTRQLCRNCRFQWFNYCFEHKSPKWNSRRLLFTSWSSWTKNSLRAWSLAVSRTRHSRLMFTTRNRKHSPKPWKPLISFTWESDENMISFSDIHPWKPETPIISTDEGISIRQRDEHSQKPWITATWLLDKKVF